MGLMRWIDLGPYRGRGEHDQNMLHRILKELIKIGIIEPPWAPQACGAQTFMKAK